MEYLSDPVGVEMWGGLAEEETGDDENVREDHLVAMPCSSESTRFADTYIHVVDSALLPSTLPDPIKIKGVGGVVLFGLSNTFDDTFPSQLLGKVAPEEFHTTMLRINGVLRKSIPLNLKCFLCGCLCCCCSFGLSLGPVLFLNKRTKSRIEKIIAQENHRLYNQLGLNLCLDKEHNDTTNLSEYVLLLQFLPRLPLFAPE